MHRLHYKPSVWSLPKGLSPLVSNVGKDTAGLCWHESGWRHAALWTTDWNVGNLYCCYSSSTTELLLKGQFTPQIIHLDLSWCESLRFWVIGCRDAWFLSNTMETDGPCDTQTIKTMYLKSLQKSHNQDKHRWEEKTCIFWENCHLNLQRE